MQANLIRKKFLDFFEKKKHKIVESDSLVPAGDPTILFTPAGMNQFKRQFLGIDITFKRAATSQRCLRTDDLDKVGKTSAHHTFFEMLGNFSFGDYFKKEAISFAWEFLTEVLKIDRKKLWVSVYHDDQEAYDIWERVIKIGKEKIVKLGDKENFWPSEAKQKGPNGPCGPCSEIFFDLGEKVGCRRANCDPSCNCGRFIEVWNLVFTQYNRSENGALKPLPKKNIDTGMGLERLAAVMQGVSNNFKTDLFQPIISEIICETKNDNPENKEFVFAIADHIRAIAFGIYDGVLPSNEARGYVIRKLVRKSTLHLRFLGIKRAFLYKLVPVLSQIMKPFYPELESRKEDIARVILSEEENFISILDSSNDLFKQRFAEFDSASDPEKAGRVIFELYDTFGIPFELTVDWLTEKGIRFSKAAFNKELLEQKTRSKQKSAMKGDVFDVKDYNYGVKETKFLGYKEHSTKAKIIGIIKDNKKINKASGADEKVTLILDKTVFYPESGGQIGDTGQIQKGKSVFEVMDTKKAGSVIIHIGKVKGGGSFRVGSLITAKINLERRLSIARNHTATHLLQAALRKVLGLHVQQQGSLVADDRLRFDFTHFESLKKTELDRIEELVNQYILNNYPLTMKQQVLTEAKKSGALAFFGEKYSGKVRVIDVGGFSRELCAGTHLNSTGEIGLFKIIRESSIASGVRRIEAVTGNLAYKTIKEQREALEETASMLNVAIDRVLPELEKKLQRIKELEKLLNEKKFHALKSSLDKFIENKQVIGEVNLVAQVIEGADMDLLRKNVDLIKEKTSNTVIALGSVNKNSALLVIGITQDLCQKGLDASRFIRDVAKFIGGSGGGRKDFAQAGGNKPDGAKDALEELKNLIGKLK